MSNNRSKYFNYIEEKLTGLASRIDGRAKLNLLDFNVHSENFYLHFFNLLYSIELTSMNKESHNTEAVDLIDKKNKIVIQVSSLNTKTKIEESLSKKSMEIYKGYTFKFISISKDTRKLKIDTFHNPFSLKFDSEKDIHDIHTILKDILSMDIEKQKEIFTFIKKELGGEDDPIKLDSNLAIIIDLLSKENLSKTTDTIMKNQFDINLKIDHNKLISSRSIIEDYSLYHTNLDSKYKQFDLEGCNKSLSVLNSIRSSYLEECHLNPNESADTIFFRTIENVKSKVEGSSNFIRIPVEELDLCLNIIIVDSFIRCKIFQSPGFQ
ncbi:ABC-three component system protein [Leptospira bandrabouensis]|uniref:SMEK domain-containing protein n=1 Tax=Leptospira bandrabouensis TaxID=2484903 RepID=A0A6H3NP63_9LEPT|nr:ABC-three component system protein [Leptospira bandrabouensis]TGN11612.1 hypothetical protein EHR08_17110 [Leptospira bandrabouensis]